MNNDLMDRQRATLDVMKRWTAIFNAGGRTTTDFANLNPDLDQVIADNKSWLLSNYDADLAGDTDRLVRARNSERNDVVNALIQSGAKVHDDAEAAGQAMLDLVDKHTPKGSDWTMLLGVAGAVVILLAILAVKR